MAVIGTFKRQGEDFAGDIQTLALKVPRVTIEREQKRSENAPDYRLYANGAEIGAAWEKAAKDSGAVFLSVLIDDPSLTAPINAALVQDSQGENWSLLWSRSK
jgi:uncharacterized protein (DUF736 family)